MPRKEKRVVQTGTERIRRGVPAAPSTDLAQMTHEDVQRLVTALEIRQIELQVQNEQLRDAQKELAESCDRYSFLYDFAPIGYVTLDIDVASFDRGVPLTMEYRLRRQDGRWRWILDNGIPLHEENGTFTGYIGSCVDVTDRKQTEQELEQYRKDLKKASAELMLAEERERQRLAEDVHDGLGQALFRARMKIDQLAIADARAKEVGTILEEMAGMMNTMTFESSPPVLRKLGLHAAVKWLARDMQKRYELVVEIDNDVQDIPIDEPVALILFRSVREVLINVAKHAQTNRANLSLRRIDLTLHIEIEDHGRGFNVAAPSHHVESGHFGLFSVRERIEYVGGTFMIQSARGAGARVILTAPLASPSATRSVGQDG